MLVSQASQKLRDAPYDLKGLSNHSSFGCGEGKLEAKGEGSFYCQNDARRHTSSGSHSTFINEVLKSYTQRDIPVLMSSL